MKYRKKILMVKTSRKHKALTAKLAAKHDAGMHNHQGGGCLLPSQLGWGQHKSDKNRVSLFDPFRGAAR